MLAILAGVLWLIKPDFRFIILGAFSTFLTSGLALYHSGIEQKWWSGPSTCSSGKIDDLSVDELFEKIIRLQKDHLFFCRRMIFSNNSSTER